MREILGSIEAEYRRYKLLAERAMAQVDDLDLSRMSGPAGNSIATLVWHVSGNLASRFTDFLRTDGEKPWRDRESEFTRRTVSRSEIREKWETGWSVLLNSLSELDDKRLRDVVTIRGLPPGGSEAYNDNPVAEKPPGPPL